MSDLTISIFGNKTFLKIINEIKPKLFKELNIKFFDNFDLYQKDLYLYKNQIAIYFVTDSVKNQPNYIKTIKKKNPIILIYKNSRSKIKKINQPQDLIEIMNMPFSILRLKEKIISLQAKHKFFQSSFISLNNYIIDKNNRTIKKYNSKDESDSELILTEKEINFLILFSQYKEPLSRNFILKNVWNYSSETETHTVETHIHRLRKKIFDKFDDKNFIKNNEKGYYI